MRALTRRVPLTRVRVCARRLVSPAGVKRDLNDTSLGASEDELLGDSDEQVTSGGGTSASEDDSDEEEDSKPKVIVGEDERGKKCAFANRHTPCVSRQPCSFSELCAERPTRTCTGFVGSSACSGCMTSVV